MDLLGDGNTDGMSKSAEEAAQRITELKSKLEAEKSEKAQLDQELMQHKQDREMAKVDLAQATEIREKEHKESSAGCATAYSWSDKSRLSEVHP